VEGGLGKGSPGGGEKGPAGHTISFLTGVPREFSLIYFNLSVVSGITNQLTHASSSTTAQALPPYAPINQRQLTYHLGIAGKPLTSMVRELSASTQPQLYETFNKTIRLCKYTHLGTILNSSCHYEKYHYPNCPPPTNSPTQGSPDRVCTIP
jgi:hypothetical protein